MDKLKLVNILLFASAEMQGIFRLSWRRRYMFKGIFRVQKSKLSGCEIQKNPSVFQWESWYMNFQIMGKKFYITIHVSSFFIFMS